MRSALPGRSGTPPPRIGMPSRNVPLVEPASMTMARPSGATSIQACSARETSGSRRTTSAVESRAIRCRPGPNATVSPVSVPDTTSSFPTSSPDTVRVVGPGPPTLTIAPGIKGLSARVARVFSGVWPT
jgi:hypothetical protein